jgi:hypothetical protein
MLENGREVFQDYGWNANASMRTAYAAVVPAAGSYPRMQVYLEQGAPLSYWKTGSSLDAAWTKARFPFFKDKDVQISAAAPGFGPYQRSARFTVEGANCAAFELRHLGPTGSAKTDDYLDSVSGFYCAPLGTALTDALLQQALESIYVRHNGKVERLVKGVSRPVPAHLM